MRNKHRITWLFCSYFLVFSLFLGACTSPSLPPNDNTTSYKNGVIVVEEGAFNNG
ncbi:MAG: hypothetical protein RI894_2563, partial [Bacteroidota bacterium]